MTDSKPLYYQPPYDFLLSLQIAAGFEAGRVPEGGVLRTAVHLDGTPHILEIHLVRIQPQVLEVAAPTGAPLERLVSMARWMINADLDLVPFYGTVEEHTRLGPIVQSLYGLKPFRPVSLFEMGTIAILEQQISLAAAHKIRGRLVQRFGTAIEGLWAFPQPESLSQASLEALRACGLSQRKAEYLQGFARAVISGELDLEALSNLSDDEVRKRLVQLRGFGNWSADYLLVRGLARPDCVPLDDLAVRSVVGQVFGDGSRLTAEETGVALEPFRPYRGLVAFYLLAQDKRSNLR